MVILGFVIINVYYCRDPTNSLLEWYKTLMTKGICNGVDYECISIGLVGFAAQSQPLVNLLMGSSRFCRAWPNSLGSCIGCKISWSKLGQILCLLCLQLWGYFVPITPNSLLRSYFISMQGDDLGGSPKSACRLFLVSKTTNWFQNQLNLNWL